MSESLAAFDSQLHDVLKKKPPISASATGELTRLASKLTVDLVPRLVTKVQNFFATSPKEYRLSAMYLVDSICKSKNDLKAAYSEAFGAVLPSLLTTLLKDASEKDEESSKKLARIWVDKNVFPDHILSGIAHAFKNEISFVVPGTEALLASPPPSNVAPISTAYAPSSAPNAYPYGSSASNASAPFPGQQAGSNGYLSSTPGASSSQSSAGRPAASSSLVDDLSSLGDLNDLLAVPSGAASAPPPSFYAPPLSNPGLPPHMPPLGAGYPSPNNSYPPRGEYRPGPGQFPPGPPYAPYGRPPGGDNSSYRPPAYGRQEGNPPQNSNYGQQGGPPSYQNRQDRPERSGPREEPPIPSGPVYSNTLFVGSLPLDISEHVLRDVFGKFGTVKKLTIKSDKGYAFVPFSTRQEAEAARNALDGKTFGERPLRIRWAKSDVYRNAQVDPETGLLDFTGEGGNTRGNGNSSPSSRYNNNNGRPNSYERTSHGIPRGIQPKMESSFADEPAPYNSGRPAYGDDEHSRGKRKYEGDQPAAEKRRADMGGFETMSSYSGH